MTHDHEAILDLTVNLFIGLSFPYWKWQKLKIVSSPFPGHELLVIQRRQIKNL